MRTQMALRLSNSRACEWARQPADANTHSCVRVGARTHCIFSRESSCTHPHFTHRFTHTRTCKDTTLDTDRTPFATRTSAHPTHECSHLQNAPPNPHLITHLSLDLPSLYHLTPHLPHTQHTWTNTADSLSALVNLCPACIFDQRRDQSGLLTRCLAR